jgi:cobalamin biosynthesis protein CbiG
MQTGVDNICERAALIGANELIVRKTAINGVTVAARLKLEVRLGRCL